MSGTGRTMWGLAPGGRRRIVPVAGPRAKALLAAELRRLREASRRTLKDLQADLHLSDSSLSRYLSGQVVPPWQVVEKLCEAAGGDPARLRPLWEQADSQGRPTLGASRHLVEPPAVQLLVGS